MSSIRRTHPAPAPIPLCEPLLGERERELLLECLDSGWISTAGPFVERFEREVAAAAGATQAVATASGTAALHLALATLGVGPGDAVAVSTLSFIAPANAIRYLGAWPVFVDAEPASWQLDVQRLAEFLERDCEHTALGCVHRGSGLRLRAILAVHVLGHPADLDALTELAERHDLFLIEDAAEALGARLGGRPVGALGRVGCFSFNGNKTVTAGGGGALVTNDGQLAARARHLATQAKSDPLASVHDQVGFNYRLTSLQAAVGCAQLGRLEELLQHKRELARRYVEALALVPGLSWPGCAVGAEPSHWLSAVRVEAGPSGVDAHALIATLRERGVQARPLWQPLHASPAHAGALAIGGEVAEALAREVVCLPSSPGLSLADFERVVDAVLDGLGVSPTRLAAAQ